MKKFLATYIILALSIFSTLAKGPVKLSGLVTDQNNEPLEFVTVKVQGKTLGTTSGLDGRYSLYPGSRYHPRGFQLHRF